MDTRLTGLAEQLDAGLIARREFLRRAAVITGGTAAGLHALRSMAPAQARTKLRVWLFKSFVTASNDVVAKQIEAIAAIVTTSPTTATVRSRSAGCRSADAGRVVMLPPCRPRRSALTQGRSRDAWARRCRRGLNKVLRPPPESRRGSAR